MEEFFPCGTMDDTLSRSILSVITKASEPLETKEIEARVRLQFRDATRTKLFYRLMLLRGDGAIHGKFVGPGKGVWIWWSNLAWRGGR